MSNWTCPTDAGHAVVNHSILGWPQCVQCGAAPSHDERQALAADLKVSVYAPREGTTEAATIPGGAAIVGLENRGEHVTVYYTRMDDKDAVTAWKASLDEATRRLATATPTRELMRAKAENLTRIGTYTTRSGTLTLEDATELEGWLRRP